MKRLRDDNAWCGVALVDDLLVLVMRACFTHRGNAPSLLYWTDTTALRVWSQVSRTLYSATQRVVCDAERINRDYYACMAREERTRYAGLTRLNVTHCPRFVFSDLAQHPRLRRLACGLRRGDDPVKLPAQLEYLSLRTGLLAHYALTLNMPRLRELHMKEGHTTMILYHATRLTSLETLVLRNTVLNETSTVSALTRLTTLSIAANEYVRDADLRPLTRLTALDLAWNSCVEGDALAALPALTRLDLTGNDLIGDATLRQLTQLRALVLDHNTLVRGATLHALTRLQTLSLHENVMVLPRDLCGLTGLTALDLFAAPDELQHPGWLTTLTRLETLTWSTPRRLTSRWVAQMPALRCLEITQRTTLTPRARRLLCERPGATLRVMCINDGEESHVY